MSKVISTENQATYIVEKSKFICSIKYVETKEEANDFIQEVSKQFWDASHNCYAYIINSNNYKFSDDGEPKGTAGLPMFSVLNNNNLENVCVVVTRYFGGKKLGAGGLVRAYSGSVVECLNHNEIITKVVLDDFEIELPISMLGKVENTLRKQQVNYTIDFLGNNFLVTLTDAADKIATAKEYFNTIEVNVNEKS